MRLQAWVQVTRPGNVALAALGVLVGGTAAAGRDPHADALLWATASAVLGVAGANALNDAADATLDRRAHPGRPVARGLLSTSEAAWWGATLLAAALWMAALAGFWVLLLATLLSGNVFLYELRLKAGGLAGNLLVSYNTGSLFVLGALAAVAPAGAYAPDLVARVPTEGRLIAPLIMAALAILLNFAREIYKDVEDAAHDAATRRTFAVRHGAARSRRLAAAVCWITAPLALAPWLVGIFPTLYAWLVQPLIALLLFVPFLRSVPAARAALKAGMVLGLVPFLATALL